MLKKTVITFACILISFTAHCQEQPQVNNVIRYGIEFGNYLSARSGSFTKSPGYTFGFLTGIKIDGESNHAFLLGIELNYTKAIEYNLNKQREYTNILGTYRDIYDEKNTLSSVELGLSIGPYFSINKDMVLGFYGGSSIGFGNESQIIDILSHSLIDSATSTNYPEGSNGFVVPVSFDAGVNYSYKRLLIDLQYRFTSSSASQGESISFNEVNLQIGIVLF